MKRRLLLAFIAILAPFAPALAKDDLGIFESWGAFRDAGVPRCYAIAEPQLSRGKAVYPPYASVGYWPKRGVRGQLHFRLSRDMAEGAKIDLRIRNRHFTLTGGGADAWAADKAMDAAITAAIRSGGNMRILVRGADGRMVRDDYRLRGAATAMDAAALACAKKR